MAAILSAYTGFAGPSGDTTGVTDTANLQAALNAATSGQTVQLAAGTFHVNAPITIPPGVSLQGTYANEVSTYLDFLTGTIIQPVAGFAQGSAPANAVIVIAGQTAGGYSTTSEEQKIRGLHIDGHVQVTGNVDGIQVIGDAHRIHLERVNVSHMSGNGVNFAIDSGSRLPDAPRLERVTARYSALAGFVIFRVSDGTYRDCLAENNTGNGWSITNASNSTYIACRSEHNGAAGVGSGFVYTNTVSSAGSGGGKFLGCSTDRNEQYGMEITSSNASGVPLILSGCAFRRDGRNGNSGGGSLAGLYITAFPGVVQVSGCTIFPGVDDNNTGTNSPQIGLLLSANTASSTQVTVSGSYIQGNTTDVSDDGTSNLTYTGTVTATGTTSSPTVQKRPDYAGIFGDGSDGNVTMDGVATFNGFSSLAGSTYTLTADVHALNLTVNNSVTLVTAGFKVFCQGALTNNGTISMNGNNAALAVQGAATSTAGSLGPGTAGAAGGTGVGTQASGGVAGLNGTGGAGGSGTSGAGGAAPSPNSLPARFQKDIASLVGGVANFNGNSRPVGGASGGSSGAGDGTRSGGAGGSGGGFILICAWTINNGSGTITATGGNGGNGGASGNAGGGGGGGGGSIVGVSLAPWTAGTLTVTGGTKGTHTGTGADGSNGGNGGTANLVIT